MEHIKVRDIDTYQNTIDGNESKAYVPEPFTGPIESNIIPDKSEETKDSKC